MWHGWADQIIMPQGSIDYYNQVVQRADGGDLAKTQDWFRFFMVGTRLSHCFLHPVLHLFNPYFYGPLHEAFCDRHQE
jgi:hypothetical protein